MVLIMSLLGGDMRRSTYDPDKDGVIAVDLLTVVSDVLRASDDSEESTSSETFELIKSITIPKNITSGTIRIKFDLKNVTGMGTAHGRIYKNDEAVGTDRIVSNQAYETFSEDIADWLGEDIIQIYAYQFTDQAKIQHFRIYCDYESISLIW